MPGYNSLVGLSDEVVAPVAPAGKVIDATNGEHADIEKELKKEKEAASHEKLPASMNKFPKHIQEGIKRMQMMLKANKQMPPQMKKMLMKMMIAKMHPKVRAPRVK